MTQLKLSSDPCADRNSLRVRCLACGFVGTLDDFDVMGANPDRLFCHACGQEVPVEAVAEEGG